MKKEDLKVLVIDDDSVSRKLLVSILQQYNIQIVIEADDGVSAIDLIEAVPEGEPQYNLFLCDYKMDNMDGGNFFKWVMNSGMCPGAKFIMVSAYSEASHIKAMAKTGISQYVLKPVEPEVLWKKICSVCGIN